MIILTLKKCGRDSRVGIHLRPLRYTVNELIDTEEVRHRDDYPAIYLHVRGWRDASAQLDACKDAGLNVRLDY